MTGSSTSGWLAGLAVALVLATPPARAQGLQVRIEPPRATLRPGAQVSTVAHAEGGSPPYRFEWFVGAERTGEVNQAKVWILRAPGRYPVRVVATDGAGRSGTAEAELTVEPYGLQVRAGPSGLDATAWGLTPPYAFQVFQGDRAWGSPRTGSSPHELLAGPGGPCRVRVVDANGVECWAEPGGPPGAPGPAPPPAGPQPSPSPEGDVFY